MTMRIGHLFGAVAVSCCLAVPIAAAQNGNGAGATGATRAAGGDQGISGAVEQKKPLLTPVQRAAIYREVAKDTSKVASKNFSPVIGGDVPPMIELYPLPDEAVAATPDASSYKYTLVENKVVLVDPTHMRVVDVIGPAVAPQ